MNNTVVAPPKARPQTQALDNYATIPKDVRKFNEMREKK
jgi:hypothetical protein